jgi:aminoglycoside phosphotransferase (APT) family kinase protein
VPIGRTPHGFGDDADSRLLRRRPPAQALDWVERSLGVTVRRVRACKGGSSSAIHVLHVSGSAGDDSVVLRRYVRPEVTRDEPDIAAREARILRLLDRSVVSTPRLLALDPTGDEAGVRAVVMTHLPGRLDWAPQDLTTWLQRLAEVLPDLHATPITDADEVQPFTPYPPESWDPPSWLGDRRLWDRGLAVFHGPCLDPERVFIHRDYHPGNVMWRRGRVSGVVDWQAASIGPRTADVWHCRGNLLGHFGVDVADRFLQIWTSITGADYNPWAETVMLIDAIGWLGSPGSEQAADLERLLAQRLAELGA